MQLVCARVPRVEAFAYPVPEGERKAFAMLCRPPKGTSFLQKLFMGETPALDSSFNGGNLRNGLSRKTTLLP